jgi:hypothetical protein
MASGDKRHQGKGPNYVKAESFKLKLGSDGLPEITSDSGPHWIPLTAAVKKYVNTHYNTLSTIFEDPLRLDNYIGILMVVNINFDYVCVSTPPVLQLYKTLGGCWNNHSCSLDPFGDNDVLTI